jgi:hypothetical protein
MSQNLTLTPQQPPDEPQRSGQILGWIIFARLLLIGVYAQSIFAGVYLSGELWGRDAHELNAGIIVMVSFISGVLALVTLRDISGGRRFAFTMLGFAICVTIQYVMGQEIADGRRLLWFHIPAGVALIGWSAEIATLPRRLGR